jgi:hypothetical protein
MAPSRIGLAVAFGPQGRREGILNRISVGRILGHRAKRSRHIGQQYRRMNAAIGFQIQICKVLGLGAPSADGTPRRALHYSCGDRAGFVVSRHLS